MKQECEIKKLNMVITKLQDQIKRQINNPSQALEINKKIIQPTLHNQDDIIQDIDNWVSESHL